MQSKCHNPVRTKSLPLIDSLKAYDRTLPTEGNSSPYCTLLYRKSCICNIQISASDVRVSKTQQDAFKPKCYPLQLQITNRLLYLPQNSKKFIPPRSISNYLLSTFNFTIMFLSITLKKTFNYKIVLVLFLLIHCKFSILLLALFLPSKAPQK